MDQRKESKSFRPVYKSPRMHAQSLPVPAASCAATIFNFASEVVGTHRLLPGMGKLALIITSLTTLCALILSAAIQASGLAGAQEQLPNATSPLGTNITSDFGNAQPFLNVVLGAYVWGFGNSGLNGKLSDLSLDSNGWPTSSYRGASGAVYEDGLGLNISPNNSFTQYAVFCNGGATIEVGNGPAHPRVNCPAGNAIREAGTFNEQVDWIFISNDDQTTKGYHLTALAIVPSQYASLYAAGQIFNPVFLKTDSVFRVLRFMDWDHTTSNIQTTNWASRPVPAQPFYNANSQTYGNHQVIPEGAPIEIETALCNTLKASCWYNIPMLAMDDYVENLGSVACANAMEPPFFEYVNEAWNTSGDVYAKMKSLGATAFDTSPSFTAAISYYTMQASHVMSLIKPKCGSTTIFRVLGLAANGNAKGSGCGNCTNYIELGGTAYGNLWSGSGTPESYFDVVAVAPYFGYLLPDSWSADAAGLTKAFTEMNFGGILPTARGANKTTNSGNNYSLISSSLCGNGSIPVKPANGTVTCAKFNTTNTGNMTLTVDGGTQYPLYFPVGNTTSIIQYQIGSGGVSANSTWDIAFTKQTGAPAWVFGTTYSQGNYVSGSDSNTYISVGNGNIGNNPITDGGVHWTALTPAWWLVNGTGQTGGMIVNAVATIVSPTLTTISKLGLSLPLVSYEMGLSMVAIADPFQLILENKINADNRMTAAYISFLNQIKSAGLTGIQNHYYDIGAWTIFGAWGMKQSVYNPPSAKQNGLNSWITLNPKSSLPYLLNRDLPGRPASDNSPAFIDQAA
jgi:hypothetical protein